MLNYITSVASPLFLWEGVHRGKLGLRKECAEGQEEELVCVGAAEMWSCFIWSWWVRMEGNTLLSLIKMTVKPSWGFQSVLDQFNPSWVMRGEKIWCRCCRPTEVVLEESQRPCWMRKLYEGNPAFCMCHNSDNQLCFGVSLASLIDPSQCWTAGESYSSVQATALCAPTPSSQEFLKQPFTQIANKSFPTEKLIKHSNLFSFCDLRKNVLNANSFLVNVKSVVRSYPSTWTLQIATISVIFRLSPVS